MRKSKKKPTKRRSQSKSAKYKRHLKEKALAETKEFEIKRSAQAVSQFLRGRFDLDALISPHVEIDIRDRPKWGADGEYGVRISFRIHADDIQKVVVQWLAFFNCLYISNWPELDKPDEVHVVAKCDLHQIEAVSPAT